MALTSNLVAYYKLDGNSNDSVGSNNGTDTSVTYSAGNGKIVQGAGLNGSSSKILLGSNVGAFTDASWAAWIKTTASGNNQVIADNVSGSGWTFRLLVSSAKAMFSLVNYGVGGGTNCVGATSINNGSWHHIVGTRSGGNYVIYVDGASDGTATGGTTTTTDMPLAFGCEYYGGTGFEFFNGAIDELGVWSRALTSGEVTSLYNAGAGLQYPFTTAPLGGTLSMMGV